MTKELDKKELDILDKAMAESANGQLIDRGSFAKYVGYTEWDATLNLPDEYKVVMDYGYPMDTEYQWRKSE